MAKDYYGVLGVDKKASQDDIKKAFRMLAHKYHPDKGGKDESKFKEITEAYSVLGDEKKRREYDTYGQSFPGGAPRGGGQQQGGFGGFDFSQFQQGFGNGGVEFDFGDIFGDIFGGGRGAQSRKPRGRDISIDIEIPFKEAVYGTVRNVLLAKVSTCDTCTGTGAKKGTEIETCKTCNGSGKVHEIRNSILGQFNSVRACTACDGSGKVPKEKCSECNGHGTRRKESEIKISIPAGIDNGEMIRMPAQGEAVKGGVSGDLYVKVHVKPHATFHREGPHLIMNLPIKVTDAVLGTNVSIELLDGKMIEVKVPPMKKAEELLRVAGKGVQIHGGKGDLIIRLEVALPHKLSSKAKKIIEDLKSEGL
jgi:molecular chaperone DnaJ